MTGSPTHSKTANEWGTRLWKKVRADVGEEMVGFVRPELSGVCRSALMFCVTFIGCTDAERDTLEDSLRRVRGSLSYKTRGGPRASAVFFPPIEVHAVVFTPTSLARSTPEDAEAIRAATALGTCRAYLVVFDKAATESRINILDDFIQEISDPSVNTVAQAIIEFFGQADAINRVSTHRGVRDAACLKLYPILALLWDCSYVVGALHVLNELLHLRGHDLWPGAHVASTVSLVALFFGTLFIVISISTVLRNTLYAVKVMKQLSLGFLLRAGLLTAAATATGYSIVGLGESTFRILMTSASALAAYLAYMYCRRVRAEVTSLSELRRAMDERQQRIDIINRVGNAPLGSNAYPFFSFRSRSLFISYAHASQWSRATADVIHRCTASNGFDVFVDRSIPAGSLWRQGLLRSLSECGFFVPVLDDRSAASQWVLAECVYAAMLRKSIGKPRTLVIIRNTEQLDALRRGPFGILFKDLFDFRHEIREGGTILIVGDDELSEARLLHALNRIRPMCLLY